MSNRRKFIKMAGTGMVGSFFLDSLHASSQIISSNSIKMKNPLIDQPGMSDPHVWVENDTCYLYTGHDIGFGVQDWVMPDWRIYKSKNLLHWEHVGTISPGDNYMGNYMFFSNSLI